MLGFQPYETFQLLIETGGIDRTNTLLIAPCDAYTRRGRATQQETDQFVALASRPFGPDGSSGRLVAGGARGFRRRVAGACLLRSGRDRSAEGYQSLRDARHTRGADQTYA